LKPSSSKSLSAISDFVNADILFLASQFDIEFGLQGLENFIDRTRHL